MLLAILVLTTANYWVYGNKKEKQKIATSREAGQDREDTRSAPNPVEEKTCNGLQQIAEYLHQHQQNMRHPLLQICFGNRHDIIHYPIHHLELITPPPKVLI